MSDSGDMFGETPPEDEHDTAPTAAELEAAGQNAMFGETASSRLVSVSVRQARGERVAALSRARA